MENSRKSTCGDLQTEPLTVTFPSNISSSHFRLEATKRERIRHQHELDRFLYSLKLSAGV